MDERHRQLSEALRLTVEYVGLKTLHPVEGWSWFDALQTEPWFDDWLESMTARDEVLKDLDADPDAACDNDLLYEAWGLIANSSGGNWEEADRLAPGWKAAAERWRDAWHRTLPGRVAPEPEWVPLTQLVGRTIDGCIGVVDRDPSALSGEGWRWYDGREWHPFPEGTLNLETGQVAVRPKAAT